jgi:serine/threonine protein kinase
MSNALAPKDVSVESLVAEAADDFMERLDRGERPQVEAYAERYPQIADVLRQVLPALELLRSAPQPPGPTEDAEASPAPVAGCLGDYRLVREVGRGGMGVVYEAEQLSLGRRVALKVLPFAAALDARQLQRFKNEAQAAAQLHHTNIVPVYGVGSERGVHFYAMQFIEGQNLAALIQDLRRLAGRGAQPGPGPASALALDVASGRWAPPRSRTAEPVGPGTTTPPAAALSTEGSLRDPAFFRTVARLGVQAAEALEHAHQLGVIHRDVKPANLLVDGRGNLWVADFGLAHCHNRAGLTLTGDLVGTLRYMSPEQALAAPAGIDHRTDLYSLGVTLYELLTLEPAFGGGDRQELLRQIAFEEPRPPRQLNRAIPAELETVVLKATAKSPAERYATAQDLADDLRRFLEDRPIRARRPTLVQRLRRWSRRHRAAVLTAAAAAVVLGLVAFAALAVSYAYVSAERDQKDAALRQARANEEAAETQRRLAEANLRLARKAVDEIYEQLADKFADQPHLEFLEREFWEKALGFYREFARQDSADPAIRLGTGEALWRVGLTLYRLDRHAEAEEALTEAVARLQELADRYPTEPEHRAKLAYAYFGLGLALAETRGSQRAEEAHRRAIGILEQLLDEHHGVPEYRKALASAYTNLGKILRARPEEAEPAHRKAIRLCEELVAEFPKTPRFRGELIRSHYSLGMLRAKSGRLQEAETALRGAIALYRQAADSLDASEYRLVLPNLYIDLAQVQETLDRPRDAEDSYREASVLCEKYVGDFPSIPVYRIKLSAGYANLVRLLERRGQSEEATRVCRRALDLYARVAARLPADPADPGIARAAEELRAVLINNRRPPEIEQGYRQALGLSEEQAARFPTLLGHQFLAAYWHEQLGGLLASLGRKGEAAHAYGRALSHYEAALGLNPNHVASLNRLSWLLATCQDEHVRDAGRAVELAKKAVGLARRAGNLRTTLGVAHYRAGDWEAARAALVQATELRGGGDGFDWLFLAMANGRLGQRDEARAWYRQAAEWISKYRPGDRDLQRVRDEAAGVISGDGAGNN